MLVIKKGTGSFEQLNTEELKKIVSTSLGYDIEKYKKNSFEFVIKGKRDFFKKLHVFPNKTFLKNSFTVTMNGESITYGYCRRLVIANKSGFSEQVLDPERDKDLYIKGRSKIVSKDNLDLVAYMLLYPECGTSEFSKSDKYSLNNVVKSASSNIASLRKTTEWKNKILNTEDLDRLTNFLQSNYCYCRSRSLSVNIFYRILKCFNSCKTSIWCVFYLIASCYYRYSIYRRS